MLKLGLLGKNIQHSQSQFMYEDILKEKVDYRLLDYDSPQKVPSLNDLFSDLSGLSITSPFKQQFNQEPNLINLFKKFSAINCIRKVKNQKFEGTNTDYLAVKEILAEIKKDHKTLNVLVMGGGVMASITKIALEELDISYASFSRSTHIADLNTLDYNFLKDKKIKPVIINCCSREFIFKANLPSETLFWDHNYNLAPHQDYLSGVCDYRDGLDLLRLQAIHALKFWQEVD